MKTPIKILLIAICATLFCTGCAKDNGRWSIEKANEWMEANDWIVGCNYQPSYAVNAIESWQEETFNPEEIDRELGLAESLGFNTIRVFLSSVVCLEDMQGFKQRFNRFLDICQSHGIRVIVTFWTNGGRLPEGHLGKQPDPTYGVHNSKWVSSPGPAYVNDESKWPELEKMVKDIVKTYRKDGRILMWSLYNEPENHALITSSVPLMSATFEWARSCKPTQPLTSPIWGVIGTGGTKYPEVTFMLENSDIITFHCYQNGATLEKAISQLLPYGRPIVCTEYMGRPESTFAEIMPILKKYNIGAINWGLSEGKDMTIFPRNKKDSEGNPIPWESEPEIWFHNIFRSDGTPYNNEEVEFIRKMTGVDK